jgi:dGTPase
MLTRKEIEIWEDKNLSPLAMKSRHSRGRKHSEKEHIYRTVYQRDRDRIIHSAAFRRLEYKTQVFVYHEGDYYRTRLTHTLEVSQIARTISKSLGLNEDLTEAIALVHDVGHTPFGHAVEMVLNELMEEEGGFNHNVQGLRIVDVLEQRYPSFRGLNLSWETREGIIKHNPYQSQKMLVDFSEFSSQEQPTLETQVMDVADEIAYDTHDFDDGIKSAMLEEDKFRKMSLWSDTEKKIKAEYTNLNKKLRIYLIIRRLIDSQVTDLIKNTLKNIKTLRITNFKEVKECKKRIVSFSKETAAGREELKEFLYKYLYSHWRVLRMSDKAKRFVRALFNIYVKNPELIHPSVKKHIKKDENLKRIICDYIAGMTDRYALEEYRRLFDPYEKV